MGDGNCAVRGACAAYCTVNACMHVRYILPDLPFDVSGGVHDAAPSAGLPDGGRWGGKLAQGRHKRGVQVWPAPGVPGDDENQRIQR